MSTTNDVQKSSLILSAIYPLLIHVSRNILVTFGRCCQLMYTSHSNASIENYQGFLDVIRGILAHYARTSLCIAADDLKRFMSARSYLFGLVNINNFSTRTDAFLDIALVNRQDLSSTIGPSDRTTIRVLPTIDYQYWCEHKIYNRQICSQNILMLDEIVIQTDI